MIAVVVSLVAVVLLVLVVVALGMRSMNRRESSLPPERLKEMAEKEGLTHARSTDEFAASEPKMSKFSPDFSPIDERKAKPVRTGQRGKRGVDEWGNPSSDDEDEEFWANIRSDAEEGGFGAGGTVAARKGASRPVDRERPSGERPGGERQRPGGPAERERPSAPAERERPAARPGSAEPGRPAARPARRGRREPVAADPNAATIQAPLPQRPAKAPAPTPAPATASAGLANLVEPVQQRPAQSNGQLADQRTVTFAAPTADVMSILGAGAQSVPSTRPDPLQTGGSFPATQSQSLSSNGQPAPGGDSRYRSVSSNGSPGSGSFPAVHPASSGSFPAMPAAPLHGAPTSDPFPAYTGGAGPLDPTWNSTPATPATTSGSWAASPDILDDPAPAGSTPSGSWPAFEPAPTAPASTYPTSYEVRPGWAVADDSDPLTGPSPATSTPTAPARAVSAYDDVLSAPSPVQPAQAYAYETGDYANSPAAWQEQPPAAAAGTWPGYSAAPEAGRSAEQTGGHRRTTPEQEFPDYYR
ncbi:hypothetical protein ACIBQX_10380 [Nonomuraea sp. NPDC049714]|uniref:hypothetical protein n=1 Tax=Nonomuraea sp. NPDC049714 TaxID=3364357 RepID=UPI00379D8993